MAQKIINTIEIFQTGSLKLRLNPTGGRLLLQKWTGSDWDTVQDWGEAGNTNNEFSFVVDDSKLKIQQIKDGGSWDGTEGTDFTTCDEFNPSVIKDYDGNIYTTVVIGNQEWMVENLKTTHYRDGTPIANITDNTEWSADSSGAYCWYNNEIANKADYGAMYNWFGVNHASGLAPYGWRIPTNADFTKLTDYLGGIAVAGGKLKEAGLTHWATPNTGATNETGFTALPGGLRDIIGTFGSINDTGDWWSSTEGDVDNAWSRGMDWNDNGVNEDNLSKKRGRSVRCVRDI